MAKITGMKAYKDLRVIQLMIMAHVESGVAYQTLENAFINSGNVDVYLELPSGVRYENNCTFTEFSLESPYDDLVTYSISLQRNGPLTTVQSTTTV